MAHALLVDDDPGSLAALTELVKKEGFSTSTARTLEEARQCVSKELTDLVLVDLKLPDGNGIDFVRELQGQSAAETVLITGYASVDSAVEALRMGVLDYLTKPLDLGRLKSVLVNVARTRELKYEVHSLRQELRELGRFGPMVGSSEAIQQVYDLISHVAPTEASVLITGESGTGKELVARTVHDLSRRNKQPFVPLNCGAVSPTLIESELFGHERGAFTGANRAHKGVFEQASGGTLLLDEITEMPAELQVKLLRVLESGSFTRVGAERMIEVDVRVVAATNRSPSAAVQDGKLREDLLYRLSVFPIHVPALRDREDDVVLLAQHFLALLNKEEGTEKRLSSAAITRLTEHDWPGNVRELKNTIQRAFILAEEELDLLGLIGQGQMAERAHAPRAGRIEVEVGGSIADAERRLILATLDKVDGNKKQAAETLGISLKTLYNRLKDYEQGSSES